VIGRVIGAPIGPRAHGSVADLLQHGLSVSSEVPDNLVLTQQKHQSQNPEIMPFTTSERDVHASECCQTRQVQYT